MAQGEDCRRERREWTTGERRRVRRTRRRCRERPWWHPERWFCEVVSFFENVWVETVHRAWRTVCEVAERAEEAIDLVERVITAAEGFVDHWLGVVRGNATGYWPIVRDVDRAVPSVPRSESSTRSFLLGTDLMQVDGEDPVQEEGAHVEVRLVGGAVEWRVNDAPWARFLPEPAHYPPWVIARPTADRALDYHDERLPEPTAPPLFDMIAAGGDRLIAKVAGSDAIYIAIIGDPFVTVDARGGRVRLPQSFFKLDPRCGLTDRRVAELTAHLRVPGDDETHPATERFPLFRAVYGGPGAVDFMTTWFAPRIWHRLDARPRRDSSPPPRVAPSYEHIVYRSNNPLAREVGRRSIRYERVLDLGVGVSHLYEQHDARFGGEIDSLSGRGGTSGEALAELRSALFGGRAFDHAYRYANGPVEDYGGWVDGTCIYFMLVQLRSEAEIAVRGPERAFGILWSDEQLVFTERWRLLDLSDYRFTAIFQPAIGIVSRLEEEFYPGAPFDPDRYFCPFVEGHVDARSRMAVARQFVAVTGRDPDTGVGEIYTTHFAWGTMDKTWRRRPLPAAPSDGRIASADAGTLMIRQDTTLALAGVARVEGKPLRGWWTQRVLPANGQEHPTVAELPEQPLGGPPSRAYDHPWRFVSDAAFDRMHRGFSHFGVLEAVDSRVQCFRVSVEDDRGLSPAAVDATVWVDRDDALRISQRRLDWGAAAALMTDAAGAAQAAVSGAGRPLEVADTRASRYHPHARVRVGFRPGLGWILMHADKRDDKNRAFDVLERSVRLTAYDDPGRSITVRFASDPHLRDPRDAHGPNVDAVAHAVSPPMVECVQLTPRVAPDGTVGQVDIEVRIARAPGELRRVGGDERVAGEAGRARPEHRRGGAAACVRARGRSHADSGWAGVARNVDLFGGGSTRWPAAQRA